MSLHMFLLHQFLLLFLLSSSFTCARHTCLEDQKFSLLQFKTTFTITANVSSPRCESDSHPKMVFWNETSDCCSWEGVTCDWSNGHVIGLDLSCSHLQGTIQPNTTLFHLHHLQTLNLAFNDFNFSTISPDFGSFPSLTHLNLSYSNFTGRIPSKICHLSKLVSLDLSYFNYYPQNPYDSSYSLARLEQHTFNMLLRNLTQLRELHLDSLNIFSPLPHALLNLSSLTSLTLRYCQLRGKFSENIFDFPNLRELGVSGNSKLTGNKFQGDIPKSIGRLNSLRGLNLSHNNLKGHIPTLFGNLMNLESLDLSSNKFVGKILQQLASLTFLEVLNLSDNQLVGRIPQGSQFNTFGNDSYNGNLALCGFLLSKKCKEQQPLPPPPTLQHDENSDWEARFNWKVVMGYGCGFVFGMVMGYLMLVTRSPEWLMKIVEGKQYKKVKRSKKSAH